MSFYFKVLIGRLFVTRKEFFYHMNLFNIPYLRHGETYIDIYSYKYSVPHGTVRPSSDFPALLT